MSIIWYEVLSTISEGAYGIVKKIKLSGNEYAMKVIDIVSREDYNSFNNEVSILKNLKHKNILKYIDHFYEDIYGNLYRSFEYSSKYELKGLIVTELCKKTLSEHISDDISDNEKVDIVMQIILGLKYIHSKSILHRDLKLSNIFIDKDDKIKIGDFGASTYIKDYDYTIVGTEGYIPPEYKEIKNIKSKYLKKIDVYTFGILLLDLYLNNANGVERGNCKDIFKLVYTEDDINLIKKKSLRNIIKSCLRKSPRKRPSIKGIFKKLNRNNKKNSCLLGIS